MKSLIEMAREAGAIPIHKSPKEFAVVGNEAIERFAELVRADEREACAKVAENTDRMVLALLNVTSQHKHIAAAIRARSNT
jgi:hypothetical protein